MATLRNRIDRLESAKGPGREVLLVSWRQDAEGDSAFAAILPGRRVLARKPGETEANFSRRARSESQGGDAPIANTLGATGKEAQ